MVDQATKPSIIFAYVPNVRHKERICLVIEFSESQLTSTTEHICPSEHNYKMPFSVIKWQKSLWIAYI